MTHLSSLGAVRILDASANRAAEGLRTIEEFARFVLEDRHLTELAKSIRHELRFVVDTLPLTERFTARSVLSDCGTRIEVSSEHQRQDAASVVAAAASRAQEAVRCIEEYGKTIAEFDARDVEAIRYRLYTLSAAVCLSSARSERLKDAKLYLLLPADSDLPRFQKTVEALFEAGVDVIQLRDKQASDRLLYDCAKIAADMARRLGKFFIVNDRADIAAATHASGVHVGQDELPVEAVRRIVGSEAIVGVSTHDMAQAKAAVLDGADYIGCGPTFPSATKSFQEFPGVDFLAQVAAQITLPAFAIGGIDINHLPAVIRTGIHGIAVSSAILANADRVAAARELKQKLSLG